MAKVRMTKGKLAGIAACADARGVIAAAAMDQRGSLKKAIAKGRGDGGVATAEDMVAFKTAVTKVLTKYASAILMDPEYGLDAIKILLYINPFDDPKINTVKYAFIERVGAECAAYDVPFFLEPLAYDDDLGDEKSMAFAKAKPKYVAGYMEEFSKPRYGVDILKVEVPVNMKFVSGTRAFTGEAAYTRQEALKLFKEASDAATKPFIYLSAGVTDEIFRETLELAAEAGSRFAGVLCGRATWQDGIPVYAKEGYDALIAWLEDRGVKNIQALNEVLAKGAKPWHAFYGGEANIEVIDPVVSPL